MTTVLVRMLYSPNSGWVRAYDNFSPFSIVSSETRQGSLHPDILDDLKKTFSDGEVDIPIRTVCALGKKTMTTKENDNMVDISMARA